MKECFCFNYNSSTSNRAKERRKAIQAIIGLACRIKSGNFEDQNLFVDTDGVEPAEILDITFWI